MSAHRQRHLLDACATLALIIIVALAGTMAFAFDAYAQTKPHIPRIGVLFVGDQRPTDPTVDGLIKGLRELGYEKDKNIIVEFRYANGQPDRLAALAVELVQSHIDVLLAGGPGPLTAARKATDSTPIVTVSGSDPVVEGWAQSLAHPGGNVTGLTVTFPEITLKRVALLKEALPHLTSFAVLMDPDEAKPELVTKAMLPEAQRMGMQVQVIEVRRPDDFERAFRSAREGHVQAILSVETTFVAVNRQQIAEFSAREKLPLVGEFTVFGVEGVLMAYGADIGDLFRRSATHIDRILKGARPGDLPIERPTKLNLTVNSKVARALGITIPPPVLLRADVVIE
jgi:putative ABC transport system substrate-binding protein